MAILGAQKDIEHIGSFERRAGLRTVIDVAHVDDGVALFAVQPAAATAKLVTLDALEIVEATHVVLAGDHRNCISDPERALLAGNDLIDGGREARGRRARGELCVRKLLRRISLSKPERRE